MIHTKVKYTLVFTEVGIRTSVTNLREGGNSYFFYPFKSFSNLKICYDKIGFSWNLPCRSFSAIVFFSNSFMLYFSSERFLIMQFTHYIKWDTNISLLIFLLKVWIWYRYKNKIEKHNHIDGEQQLSFNKISTDQNTQAEQNEGYSSSAFSTFSIVLVSP